MNDDESREYINKLIREMTQRAATPLPKPSYSRVDVSPMTNQMTPVPQLGEDSSAFLQSIIKNQYQGSGDLAPTDYAKAQQGKWIQDQVKSLGAKLPAIDMPETTYQVAQQGPKKNLQEPTAKIYDLITNTFKVTPGGWREKGSVPNSDHPKGYALDVPAQGPQGDKVAQWAITQPDVKYVIWNNQIWKDGKWKPYKHPAGNNPRLNHEDHVHISLNDKPSAKSQAVEMLGGGRMGMSIPMRGESPPTSIGPPSPPVEQRGKYLVADYTALTEDRDLQWLIDHESDGYLNKKNPKSTAYGLGQLLYDNRTRYAKKLGIQDPNTTDPREQLAMMQEYIKERYKTPARARAFWQKNGWY